MPSRMCRVQLLQSSVAKVTLCCYLVWFAIKFCFVLDTHDTNAIAINKICKLNLRYFTMYLTISQQHGYQGFFEYGVYFS